MRVARNDVVRAAIGVAGAVLFVLLIAAPVGPLTPLWRDVLDWLHVPLFAAVYVALHYILRRGERGLRGVDRRSILAALLLAILSESLQPLFARSADVMDLIHDIVGAATGWALLGGARRMFPSARRAVVIIVACAMIATVLPPLATLAAQVIAARRFPVLYSGNSLEGRLWETNAGGEWTSADHVMSLLFSGDGWPGATLHLPDQGWGEHGELVLEARSLDSSFEVGVRIDYARDEHPRHHFEFEIGSEWRTYGFSLAELPSGSGIVKLVIFVEGNGQRRRIRLRDLRLR